MAQVHDDARAHEDGQPQMQQDFSPQPYVPHSIIGQKHAHSVSTSSDNRDVLTNPVLAVRGKIRMIVNRQTSKRAKMEAVTSRDPGGAQDLLGILIPHYRLGTPRFTGHGSAVLQSTLHTESSINGDGHSLISSKCDRAAPLPSARGMYGHIRPRDKSDVLLLDNDQILQAKDATIELLPVNTNFNPWTEIPTMQPLTSYMDDPSLIRLSPTSGQLIAATPSRMIAQITSPNLLDYDLLSDFFLTFRSYISPQRLVAQLLARLQWAVSHVDDYGRIVRVRAFVALRHWILNYFADDFVPDYDLRWHFCRLVNAMCYELALRRDSVPGDLKILGELKRCWRRTYALYWDVDLPRKPENIMDKIEPGGRVRSSGVPSFDARAKNDQQSKIARRSRFTPNAYMSGFGVPFVPQYNLDDSQHFSINISSPWGVQSKRMSTSSDISTNAFACAIPAPIRSRIKLKAKAIRARGPRPVPIPASADPTARMVERLFTESPPRRSGSFVNSLNEEHGHVANAQIIAEKSNQPMTLPGSLIRGIILQPFTAYIDSVAPTTPPKVAPIRDCGTLDHIDPFILHEKNSAAFNPRTKKMIGNVKRAISSRHTSSGVTTRAIKKHMASFHGGKSRSSTAPVESTRDFKPPREKPRIDLLAASVEESFRRAAAKDEGNMRENRAAAVMFQNDAPGSRSRQDGPKLSGAPPSPPDEPIMAIGRRGSDASTGSFSLLMLDESDSAGTPNRSLSAGFDNVNAELVPDVPLSKYTMPGVSYARLSGASGTDLAESPDRLRSRSKMAFEESPEAPTVDAWPLPVTGIRAPAMEHPRFKKGYESSSDIRYYHSSFFGHHPEPPRRPRARMTGTHSSGEDTGFDEMQAEERLPARQLRRRPGGDLSKADNVHDLILPTQSRISYAPSRFTRSMTNQTRSLPAAFTGSSHSPDGRRRMSLIDTHSSRAHLRPSFELQVARLAQIPDPDEDGGIESTLLKLEGRNYRGVDDIGMGGSASPGPPQSFSTPRDSVSCSSSSELLAAAPSSGIDRAAVDIDHRGDHQQTTRSVSNPTVLHRITDMGLRAIFAASYPSNPMPARVTTTTATIDHHAVKPTWLNSLPRRQEQKVSSTQRLQPERSNSSEALLALRPSDDIARESTDTHRSFLLDDDESIMTVSMDDVDDDDDVEQPELMSFYNHDSSSLMSNGSISCMPVTPPQLAPIPKSSPLLDEGNKARLLRVPSPKSTVQADQQVAANSTSTPGFPRSKSTIDIQDFRDRPLLATTPAVAHFPFILAYDAKTIAEQFTLIEKDALSEIDWRELIEIRWAQSAPVVRNWVEFLGSSSGPPVDGTARGGIDMCTARFNVMVKWAVSEIVLTQDVHERAACIVKYIHIASHCRRLRNWATMYQIAAAMCSADCRRLRRSWALVPSGEQAALKELETLITPTRNFANLRAEMEAAGARTGADVGVDDNGLDRPCVPFIGIYTHDLIYNAQKPAFLPAGRAGGGTVAGGEQLVNMERQRAAAGIVKNLLRMLEASMLYRIQPVADLLSRCLWMAALRDEEIARKSRELEP